MGGPGLQALLREDLPTSCSPHRFLDSGGHLSMSKLRLSRAPWTLCLGTSAGHSAPSTSRLGSSLSCHLFPFIHGLFHSLPAERPPPRASLLSSAV